MTSTWISASKWDSSVYSAFFGFLRDLYHSRYGALHGFQCLNTTRLRSVFCPQCALIWWSKSGGQAGVLRPKCLSFFSSAWQWRFASCGELNFMKVSGLLTALRGSAKGNRVRNQTSVWHSFIFPILGYFRRRRGRFLLSRFPEVRTFSICDLGGSEHFWDELSIGISRKRITLY